MDALDSILENSVGELDEALRDEIVDSRFSAVAVYNQKTLPSTPPQARHLSTDIFTESTGEVCGNFDSVVSDSTGTLGSQSSREDTYVSTPLFIPTVVLPPYSPQTTTFPPHRFVPLQHQLPASVQKSQQPILLQHSSPVVSDLTQKRVGRWSSDEKILFLHGLKEFGKGRWKLIQKYIPGRYVSWCLYHVFAPILVVH